MKYLHVLRAVYSTPWMIVPEKLNEIVAFLELKASGVQMTPEQIKAAVGEKKTPPPSGNGVAVIPVYGIISKRLSAMDEISGPGGTSCEKLSMALKSALADPNVGTIVLDIHSPGGTIGGVPEVAEEIYQARAQKKIIAVADTQACSAAYWIGTAASEFVASPSANVGSIGVYMAHADISAALEKEGVKVTLISAGKYKTEGNEFGPLDEEAQAYFQKLVTGTYDEFVKAVAKHMGVSVTDVRNGFGEGRVLNAKDALKAGMVHRVATLDQVLQKLGVSRAPAGAMRAEGELPEQVAEGEDAALEQVSAETNDEIERLRREFDFA